MSRNERAVIGKYWSINSVSLVLNSSMPCILSSPSASSFSVNSSFAFCLKDRVLNLIMLKACLCWISDSKWMTLWSELEPSSSSKGAKAVDFCSCWWRFEAARSSLLSFLLAGDGSSTMSVWSSNARLNCFRLMSPPITTCGSLKFIFAWMTASFIFSKICAQTGTVNCGGTYTAITMRGLESAPVCREFVVRPPGKIGGQVQFPGGHCWPPARFVGIFDTGRTPPLSWGLFGRYHLSALTLLLVRFCLLYTSDAADE